MIGENNCVYCKHFAFCDPLKIATYVDKVCADFELFDDQADEPQDIVNHPAHYETGKFECIDVMLETQGRDAVLGFCVCNAFKYLYRHRRKNGVEDLKKAAWYIAKAIELEGGGEDDKT